MANVYSNRPQVRHTILSFLKNLVSKAVLSDVNVLLSPCCKPTISIATKDCGVNCGSQTVGTYGVQLTSTITDVNLAGKTVTAIVSGSTGNSVEGGAIKVITFDSLGVWTGCIQTSWENLNPITVTLTVTLLLEGSKVARISDSITVTLTNCD